MTERVFETDFRLTLKAARQTLANHPRLCAAGYLTSPYGPYLGPLALMMRELYDNQPYGWDEIARGMATSRETLDDSILDIRAELKKPEKRKIYNEFEGLRKSLGQMNLDCR